jgi:hypothetical protein
MKETCFDPSRLCKLKYLRPYLKWFFFHNLFYVKEVKGKGIIRVVEIGEIVDHHHLLLLNLYFSM